MTNPATFFLNLALRLWSACLSRLRRPPGIKGVLLHDPQSQKPKDLDNPFNEAGAQERVGDLIGRSYADGERKTRQ